jgi:hypothetical protein
LSDLKGQQDFNKWYELRLHWSYSNIKCYLNNTLIYETNNAYTSTITLTSVKFGDWVSNSGGKTYVDNILLQIWEQIRRITYFQETFENGLSTWTKYETSNAPAKVYTDDKDIMQYAPLWVLKEANN